MSRHIPPRLARAIRIALGIGVTLIGGGFVLFLFALNGYTEDEGTEPANTLWLAIPLALAVAAVAVLTVRAIARALPPRRRDWSITDVKLIVLSVGVFTAILILRSILS
jgi:membrane protease YdiL (CAAX protease family)